MLSSITPLGERGRAQRWWLTVTVYILGSTLGGLVVGALLGLVGTPLRAAGLEGAPLGFTVVGLAFAALVFDAARTRIRLPRYGRQVNEDWMSRYRGWVYGGGYGLQLGAGLTTIVTAALVYLVFLLCLLSGSWETGAMLGATFGFVRGVVVLTTRRVHDAQGLVRFHRRLQAVAPSARAATLVAEVVVIGAGVAVAMGS